MSIIVCSNGDPRLTDLDLLYGKVKFGLISLHGEDRKPFNGKKTYSKQPVTLRFMFIKKIRPQGFVYPCSGGAHWPNG